MSHAYGSYMVLSSLYADASVCVEGSKIRRRCLAVESILWLSGVWFSVGASELLCWRQPWQTGSAGLGRAPQQGDSVHAGEIMQEQQGIKQGFLGLWHKGRGAESTLRLSLSCELVCPECIATFRAGGHTRCEGECAKETAGQAGGEGDHATLTLVTKTMAQPAGNWRTGNKLWRYCH